MAVASARGSELEREFAFGVARQLLEPVLVRADAAARAEILKLRALLRGGLPGRGDPVVSFTHRVGQVNELWQGRGGSVRTAGLGMRKRREPAGKIRAAVQRLEQEYRAEGELVIPVCAKIARGKKP